MGKTSTVHEILLTCEVPECVLTFTLYKLHIICIFVLFA